MEQKTPGMLKLNLKTRATNLFFILMERFLQMGKVSALKRHINRDIILLQRFCLSLQIFMCDS